MIVQDADYLAYLRGQSFCWWCRRRTPGGCDPAHVRARGIGGGSQIDTPMNVAALCADCHRNNHAGKSPMRGELWLMLDRRFGFEAGTCEQSVNELMRRPKGNSDCRD